MRFYLLLTFPILSTYPHHFNVVFECPPMKNWWRVTSLYVFDSQSSQISISDKKSFVVTHSNIPNLLSCQFSITFVESLHVNTIKGAIHKSLNPIYHVRCWSSTPHIATAGCGHFELSKYSPKRKLYEKNSYFNRDSNLGPQKLLIFNLMPYH